MTQQQSKAKQANEQAKAQNLLQSGEKKKHYIKKMKRTQLKKKNNQSKV